ncbi:hypothetical protein B5C09_02835 [Staphylococcus delphini]|nr:hypothetical protein B5C09_02835 [Staphylococcus delphini]
MYKRPVKKTVASLNLKNNHLTPSKLGMVIFLTFIAIKTTKLIRTTTGVPRLFIESGRLNPPFFDDQPNIPLIK